MTTAEMASSPTITVDAAQVAQHQAELTDQGFTLFHQAMTPAQVHAGRAAIDARIAAGVGIDAHADVFGEANLVAKAEVFRELAQHPLLIAVVEGLIGRDCILSSCNQGTRRPGGERQGLHRDTWIWGESMPLTDFPIGIQTAWCFDDFTVENGATHLIPTSHRRPNATAEESSIQATAPAGSIIAFDSRIFHAGGANRTQSLRRAALTLYIRSWLKPQTDHARSYPRELIASASPLLLRLLGFQRQTPVERADGCAEYLMAPGATLFYGQTPSPRDRAAP